MTTTTVPRTQDLSEGALGMALLDIERRDLATARRHLAQATARGVSTGSNASLFHGAPALEFVLARVHGASEDVRVAVDRVVNARLVAAHRRQAAGALPHLAEWDLIRGLTGLAALLLSRRPIAPRLPDVLACLVALAHPARGDGRMLPGWWSLAGPDGKEMAGGHGNNGMAHGIAGPLAVLSLALREGVSVPGQEEAVGTFATWLDRHGTHYWSTTAHLDDQPPAAEPARQSWCYGRPGIARAQQLAALALGDTTRRQAAEDTVVTILTDPLHLARITDSTLCHGWAGLLTLTRAVAADSPAPDRFSPIIRDLHRRLANSWERLPKLGFMEGRAGAQLALNATDTTGWSRALLLT
ncbi:lanthionine synthetase LanC family protein [Streptomyces lancefieldiae]|uniref:Lanthionine synthetase LanC family protein n=1 Tax=Streptomyces lancefieldiae TaxID=3075520 RepID=A0ABU3AYF3_9ACTN|nr:lanthionine synthetase LanC family protein [Streptomyces sp. DSM 40712]MDT0615219.1 lanthionine synthetase LanC family protein [Streptomyces sp. DSM 40712]